VIVGCRGRKAPYRCDRLRERGTSFPLWWELLFRRGESGGLCRQYLAVCLETKNWLGLKTRQAGLLYSIQEQEAVGKIVAGKRGAQGWLLEKTL